MQEIVGPIAALIKWTFDEILVPIGELPDIINPNYIFLAIGFVGLFYWLILQKKYNTQADNTPGQIK
ncbi:hypothetical protein O3Q51_03845 [Cryomorphaceae bacterium 1068]|nr:hypothetical protein [Cryomorphaceae bacterium 1068]